MGHLITFLPVLAIFSVLVTIAFGFSMGPSSYLFVGGIAFAHNCKLVYLIYLRYIISFI
jgi:uncharacterized membrane protein YfbV (UPF0208 family)